MPIEISDANRKQLVEDAQAVLRDNDRGTYTVPSNKLYPYQWAWDSAFLAIGWSTFDVERAVVELETLMSGQWEDGRIPHIHFWKPDENYYPGPAVWGHQASSTITNPAVFALALERVLTHGTNGAEDEPIDAKRLQTLSIANARGRVVALLEAIERFHLFLRRERDPLGLNCVSCSHPWESGRDNCVTWDEPMAAVDITGVDASGRKDKDKVDNPEQRPTDTAYKGYLALVEAIRKAEFGPGPFAVYDPFLTTLLVLSEQSLERMARAVGDRPMADRAKERAAKVEASLHKHLWDKTQNAYAWKNAKTNRNAVYPVLAAYFPLLLDPPAAVRTTLETRLRDEHFGDVVDFPTLAPSSDHFDAVCYWRGPQWINMTWFFRAHDPDRVDDNILRLVTQHGFSEYFDPTSGAPLGASNFGWSAALTLDILR